jgi:hypothetical protein
MSSSYRINLASTTGSCILILFTLALHSRPLVTPADALQINLRSLLVQFMDGHNGTAHNFLSASGSSSGYVSTSTPEVHIANASGHVDSVGSCCLPRTSTLISRLVQFNVASLRSCGTLLYLSIALMHRCLPVYYNTKDTVALLVSLLENYGYFPTGLI